MENPTDHPLVKRIAAEYVDVLPIRRNKDTEVVLRMMLAQFKEELDELEKGETT